MSEKDHKLSSLVSRLITEKQRVFSPYSDLLKSDPALPVAEAWLSNNFQKYGEKGLFSVSYKQEIMLRIKTQNIFDKMRADFETYVEEETIEWLKSINQSFDRSNLKKPTLSNRRYLTIEPDGSSDFWSIDQLSIILTNDLWTYINANRQSFKNLCKAKKTYLQKPIASIEKEKQTGKFYKLKREGNTLLIIKKVPFDERNSSKILEPFARQALDFAYEMAFGDGEHRRHRSGGTHLRRSGEIFSNAFQGKLSEFAVYQTLLKTHNLTPPDLSIHGLGVWDSFDLKIDGKKVSIKSTKHYGNLLLLEEKDWDENGQYIPNQTTYDQIVLVRIKPDIEQLLKKAGYLYSDAISKKQTADLLASVSYSFDIPGYINRQDLIYLINNHFIIHKGEMLNGTTKMDATNYYCRCADMRKLEI